MSTESNVLSVVIKWSGSEYPVDVPCTDNGSPTTVLDLKKAVHAKTGVRPDRQKLLGLKSNGKAAVDDTRISDLSLKPGTKLMMMGSREEDIAEVSKEPEGLPEVINDLDVPDDVVIPLAKREEYLAKIEKRVKEVKIEVLNPPRPGKKLLVLDIDYTLFDHRSVAEHPHQLMRPYLHEFLTSAYEDYDIVIWSATSMKWIEVKMRQLGVTSNPNYKITFMIDSLCMICLHTQEYGFLDVKPLGVIWGKFPEYYSAKNTIMFDDIRRNFLMNPQNGLRIKAFREAHKNRDKDRELHRLARYLKIIAGYDDLSELDHRHWKTFIRD